MAKETWTLSVYCESLKEIEIPSKLQESQTLVEKVKRATCEFSDEMVLETSYEF